MSLAALMVVLIVTAQQVSCRSTQALRPGPSVMLQSPQQQLEQEQDPEMENNYDQTLDMRSSREMSTMLMDLMKRTALQRRQHEQQQKQQDFQQQLERYIQKQQQLQEQQPDEVNEEESRGVSEDVSAYQMEQDPQVPVGKRGSYMSLCHFKICNMGRKRNLQSALRPQWARM